MIVKELVTTIGTFVMTITATGEELRNVGVVMTRQFQHREVSVTIPIHLRQVTLMVENGYIDIKQGNEILAFAGIKDRLELEEEESEDHG